MNAYIPDKKTLEDIVSRVTKKTIKEVLPEAIRKGTRKKWLTTAEVSEILSCSKRHIQFLRDENLIEYHQTGRTVRYNIEAVEDYLNKGKVERNSK